MEKEKEVKIKYILSVFISFYLETLLYHLDFKPLILLNYIYNITLFTFF